MSVDYNEVLNFPDDAPTYLSMGSCFYSPPGKQRSKTYYAFDNALDTFDERWQGFGYGFTNALRSLARKLDDKFGGDE